MEDLLRLIRVEAPTLSVGWANDGTSERLPRVLLEEASRAAAVFGDNAPVAARQVIEAGIFAAEQRQCEDMGGLIANIAARRGFILTDRRTRNDGKTRGVTLTLERWMPIWNADGALYGG
ncbi:MAG: hypothetical protein LBB86_07895 [Oscillospiraceae bacterium]|nr:hypothetical protein [Oscillospiraceae bacterium]